MSFPYITDLLNAIFGTHWHLPIPVFGTLVATAIVLATLLTRRAVQRYETVGKLPIMTHTFVSDLILTSTIAGLIGARVFHILDYTDQFLADPAAMILSRAGFSIYGGLVFGIATATILLARRSIPILPMLDVAAPGLMLGYAIGRLGCQIAGDGDWGIVANMAFKPTWLPEWLWAQTYNGNIAGVVIPAPGVYPTPIYESAMALVIFGVLMALRSDKHRDGYLFSVYLLLAGFERLLIEKIRVNVDYHVLGISFTQAEGISLFLIVIGFVGVLVTLRPSKFWTKAAVTVAVLSALSACVPH